MASNTSPKKSGRWVLIAIFLLFAGPVTIAWFLYSQGDISINKTTNNGKLLIPPLDMSQLSLTDTNNTPFDQKQLRGKWLLLYVAPPNCHKECKMNLYNIRQIRTATGKNMGRVNRVVISLSKQTDIDELIKSYFKGTTHVITNKATEQKLALRQGSLYLVDPMGNIMMSYAPKAPASGVLKDIERLLKVSQIG